MWDYRVIRKVCPTLGEPYFGIYEVHYNVKGGIIFITEDACGPHGRTEWGLTDDLGRMMEALDLPVLIYEKLRFAPDEPLGDKCDRHDFNVPQV
ncbi:MAG: hypothetical protein ACRDHG_04650 [Anaerolineales bacterium]